MPIPTPKKDEKQNDFVSRCMGDSVMNKDYPNQKQRAAICYSQWGNSKKSTGQYSRVNLVNAIIDYFKNLKNK